MNLTFSRSGQKAEVLEQLRDTRQSPANSPAAAVESIIANAIATHLDKFAADGIVSVTVGVSVNYNSRLDNDGNEIAATPVEASSPA